MEWTLPRGELSPGLEPSRTAAYHIRLAPEKLQPRIAAEGAYQEDNFHRKRYCLQAFTANHLGITLLMAIIEKGSDSSSKHSISVFFGTRQASRDQIPDNSVLLVPAINSWNDFGYHTRIELRIKIDEFDFDLVGTAFLGFIMTSSDARNGVDHLNDLLSDVNGFTLPASDQHRFFTMLPDMEVYRTLVRKIGAERATKVLLAIKDLVALQEFSPRTNWLEAAVDTQVFRRSFMRNTESFFAFKNAGSVLRGLEQEAFHRVSKSIAIQFQLPGRIMPHELTFRFDHDAELPKRIAVIIGKNGVGKSQTLNRIVRSALDGRGSLYDADSGERVLVNRLLAFAPTNEMGSVFPSDQRKRPKVWYRRFSLNRAGARWQRHGVADSIVQLARSPERIGAFLRWDIFMKALEAIDGWEEIHLSLVHGKHLLVPLRSLAHGGEQEVLDRCGQINTRKEPLRVIGERSYPLSSGEISFLRFAAQASLHIENGSLLLLDEPETHLHPNFISQFVALLDRILEQTGSIAIVATHSAYIVREVFQDQVTVLRGGREGDIATETCTLRTFGADIGAISYFVFGEDAPSRLADNVKTRLQHRYASWGALFETYKHELSLEILGALREAMESSDQS